MKISTDEVERIKRIGSRQDLSQESPSAASSNIMESSTTPDIIHQVASIVDSTPDVREEVIAAIRTRTTNGTYRVTSDEIADLIVRRALADKIR